MRTLMTITIFVFCLVAIEAQAQSENQSEFDSNKTTIQKLEEQWLAIDYFESRMEDVLSELETDLGLVIRLDESAADNNLDEETLITLTMPRSRLVTVINSILDPYQCTWTIRDGQLILISRDHAKLPQNQGIRVFDCSELISNIEPITITRRVPAYAEPEPKGFSKVNGIAPAAGGVFHVQDPDQEAVAADPAVPSTPEETATNESAAEPNVWTQPVEYTETLKGGDQLQKLISKTVDPLSWESRGGYGQISIINDLIVVRQSWSNLREIELLLDSIQNAGQ